MCKYDLCEACGLSAGAGCPKLKCNNNHELLWNSDACMYYESKGKGHNFLCKQCNARKDETHWHCRQCEYDICQSCGLQQNYPALTVSITCPNSHSLQEETQKTLLLRHQLRDISCGRCQNSIAWKCYICEQCRYVICGDCHYFLESPAAGHPVIRCDAAHLLRWVGKGRFTCNYCEETKSEERYRCEKCDFDMCAQCSNALLGLILRNKGITHVVQNHQFYWNPKPRSNRGEPVQCNGCGVRVRRGGMFFCLPCSKYYCVLCCDNPNRRKLA